MTEKQLSIISENLEVCKQSIENVLDSYYDVLAPYDKEKGLEFPEDVPEAMQKFVEEVKEAVPRYEALRRKFLDNNLVEVDKMEFNMIIIAIHFSSEKMKNIIKLYEKTTAALDELISKLRQSNI